MTFTQKVLTGLAAGVLCGLFLGERAGPLQVVATGFVKLMQMTVLPYVFLSIVCSLGSLDYAEARRLGLRVGLVIAGLWAVALFFVLLIPLTFPAIESGSFFSTSLLEPRHPFNVVDLYIPANPFHSLANNIVPAIVLFSVLLGVGLIGVPEKKRLLEVMTVGINGLSRATRFIVKLTPVGIFAIAAHSAGTLSLEQVGRIEIFLVAYAVIALLLAIWVLPGLVAALTPIRYRDVLFPNRDALVTALVAGDVFIILPSLMESCERILLSNQVGKQDEHKLPEIIVPAAFNFPHTGKILTLSFILFAGWFSDAALSSRDYPQLASAGLMSIFGSLNSAIPFLLDLFHIPADTFQLFLATGVINARVGSLLSGVHLITVSLLGSAALAGMVQFRVARIVRFLAITVILSSSIVLGLRVLFETQLKPVFDGTAIVNRLEPMFPSDPTRALPEVTAADLPAEKHADVYAALQARGALRVGVFQNRLPFAYRNSAGRLVGFELEAAQMLAHELDVKLQLVLVTPNDFASALENGRCDIVMSGIAVTPTRQADLLYSNSYLDQTLSFAVRDFRRDEFLDWDTIRSRPSLRLAVPNVRHYLELVGNLLPNAKVVPIDLDAFAIDEKADFDAFVLTAEIGAAQTLLKPQFTIVVPAPAPIRIPTAYPLAGHDERWARVVNSWIELKQRDGTFDRLYHHWVLGQSAKPKLARWSIAKNVLHWGE